MFLHCHILLVLVNLVLIQSIAPISVPKDVGGKKYEISSEDVDYLIRKMEKPTWIESTKQNIGSKGKDLSTFENFKSLESENGDKGGLLSSVPVSIAADIQSVKTPDEVKASLTPNHSFSSSAVAQSSSSLSHTSSSDYPIPADILLFDNDRYEG
jgi:hypothetical protein